MKVCYILFLKCTFSPILLILDIRKYKKWFGEIPISVGSFPIAHTKWFEKKNPKLYILLQKIREKTTNLHCSSCIFQFTGNSDSIYNSEDTHFTHPFKRLKIYIYIYKVCGVTFTLLFKSEWKIFITCIHESTRYIFHCFSTEQVTETQTSGVLAAS